MLLAASLVAVWHENVAHAPDRLDIARLGRIGFDQAAQTRDLHIDGALQGIPFTTTGKVHQLVAGQGFTGVLHQRLEHCELTGGEHMHLVALLQLASAEEQLVVTEGHRLVFTARRARHLWRLAAQHGTYPRQQFTRIERLGQVIVGPLLQPLDATGLVALGGKHDDRNLIAAFTQAVAGRQAVLTGHHQVQYHQVEQLAAEQTIHLLGAFHGTDTISLLIEKAFKQTPQTGIVIDDEDLFTFAG